MKPVSFGYPAPGGFQEWVIKALRQVETASRATLTNDTASSAGAMNSLPAAAANQFPYFTSQTTTAYASLSALALALLTLQRTAVGDANYQVLVTDGIVATSAALSVARTWTMAKASTVAAGQPVNLVDEVGGITAANTLTVAVTAGDKLNGVLNDTLVLNQANAWIWLESDGSGNWSYSLITTPLLAQLAVTTAKLAANAVTNTKLAQMAQATVKGRAAASGTGDPVDLSQAQLTALVNAVTTSLSGAVPAAPNDATKFFRGDATFAVPPNVSASAAGYITTYPNNTTTFFRGDGTYAAPAVAFTKSFTSSQQTITAGGSTTLAHSLGATPTLIQIRIVCGTANLNYSVNDEVVVTPVYAAAIPDATNVVVVIASGGIFVPNKTTGSTATGITAGSWTFVVRAWL